jgi:hypothetical protein
VRDFYIAAFAHAIPETKVLRLFGLLCGHGAVGCLVRPNVRVQPRAAAWRLAREAQDKQWRFAGQAPCR